MIVAIGVVEVGGAATHPVGYRNTWINYLWSISHSKIRSPDTLHSLWQTQGKESNEVWRRRNTHSVTTSSTATLQLSRPENTHELVLMAWDRTRDDRSAYNININIWSSFLFTRICYETVETSGDKFGSSRGRRLANRGTYNWRPSLRWCTTSSIHRLSQLGRRRMLFRCRLVGHLKEWQQWGGRLR